MEINGKNVPRLRQVIDVERATEKKARESWNMFTIMAEFIDATERLSELRPAVSIFGSARTQPGDHDYALALDIARRMSDAGFAVMSGGGPGIMEAANKGAFEGRSASIGLNIELPREQASNAWQNISISFRHFFARKVAFVKYADAYIVLPGGLGTLD
jgi:predicted Rossmann-fold nucleotide-binding protein